MVFFRAGRGEGDFDELRVAGGTSWMPGERKVVRPLAGGERAPDVRFAGAPVFDQPAAGFQALERVGYVVGFSADRVRGDRPPFADLLAEAREGLLGRSGEIDGLHHGWHLELYFRRMATHHDPPSKKRSGRHSKVYRRRRAIRRAPQD